MPMLWTQLEGKVFPEQDVKEISQPSKIRDLYFDLLKSSKKEIMLIIPSNNAFERQEWIGIIGVVKQVAEEKTSNVRVRVLVAIKNLENGQELAQKPFPLKENYQQDHNNSIYIRYMMEQQSADLQETILIVDRKVSFVIEVIDDTKAIFEEAIGLATYSNAKSTVLSFVSIFESLWKQTELYQKLKELYERAKELDKIQKEFIGIAAHELRAPIQPILGLSELLLSSKGNIGQDKDFLNVIVRNAKRLQKLTENILDITNIENDLLNIDKGYFSLNDIIKNVLADLKKEEENNKERKINLAYSSNSDNIIVNVDMARITQVVSNLLSNAIKFTRKGEISINVTKNDTDQQIIVRVTDTGQGIDPGIMSKLFTKFATKSNIGTGLGLYLSKRIIEAHGGKMWAENNSDGIGATFSFTLPLVIQQNHKESLVIDTVSTINNGIEERRKKRSIYHNLHGTKMKRIFLVDDDYDHTTTFKIGLELAGFEVDAYNDPAIALSKFKPGYYDLLLIDFKMPKIDGVELYEKIRKLDDKVMLWFITAYETYYKSLIETSSISNGENSSGLVIEKPIEIATLVEQIKTELE